MSDLVWPDWSTGDDVTIRIYYREYKVKEQVHLSLVLIRRDANRYWVIMYTHVRRIEMRISTTMKAMRNDARSEVIMYVDLTADFLRNNSRALKCDVKILGVKNVT